MKGKCNMKRTTKTTPIFFIFTNDTTPVQTQTPTAAVSDKTLKKAAVISKTSEFNNYSKSIKESPDLLHIVDGVLAGIRSQKNHFYKQYNKLVAGQVRIFVNHNRQIISTSEDDYINECWCYIFENLHKYDPTKAKITTFLSLQIKACLCRYREKYGTAEHIPVSKSQLFAKINKYVLDKGINTVSKDEIQALFDIDDSDYIAFCAYATGSTSIDAAREENENNGIILGKVENVYEDVIENDLAARLINNPVLSKAEKKYAYYLLGRNMTDNYDVCAELHINLTDGQKLQDSVRAKSAAYLKECGLYVA